MQPVFVIGSNSFSGATFVDYLLDQGQSVIGMSRSAEPNAVFLPYKKNAKLKNFTFHALDLNLDLDRILQLIGDLKPDYVVNFAAQGMVAQSWQIPEHWFQTNTVANVRLHDGLRKFPFLKKYLHVSTPEVYGNTEGLIQEHRHYNPSTPYAVSRAAADLSLWSFFQNYKFPVAFTRAANVYGPGQQLYRIIPRTILFARLGRKLQLQGGGHSVRSFIHMRDVADATWRVTREAQAGEIYHISTERNLSIRELVELICRLTGVPFADLVELADDRPGKDAAYLLDSGALKKNLGWSDRISLEEGLKDTIAWIDENLETIRNQPFDYVHKP